MQHAKSLLLSLTLIVPVTAFAAETCKNRGGLDATYCDENRDLIADAPKNPADYKNPATLNFSYIPAQDAAIHEKAFAPFMEYLAKCTGKNVVYSRMNSEAEEIEAIRTGKLHIAALGAGSMTDAINRAGAVPFATNGNLDVNSKTPRYQGYNLVLIVRKDSPYRRLADLKGKKVAHVSPTSNSGHHAPIALLPSRGLTPEKDYTPIFSGRHDASILGVSRGEYDAAPVASSVFIRMAQQKQIREEDFRFLYISPRFPAGAFTHPHDLHPGLRDSIVKCFFDFRYPDSMQKHLDSADRFVPISYQKDWTVVRLVNETSKLLTELQAKDKPSKK